LNGTAAGAGAAIAPASDLRIAADTARIAFLFVKVGLSGADMGAAHLLPRVVGAGRAAELLMTGAFIAPAEGRRLGLYDRRAGAGWAGSAGRGRRQRWPTSARGAPPPAGRRRRAPWASGRTWAWTPRSTARPPSRHGSWRVPTSERASRRSWPGGAPASRARR